MQRNSLQKGGPSFHIFVYFHSLYAIQLKDHTNAIHRKLISLEYSCSGYFVPGESYCGCRKVLSK